MYKLLIVFFIAWISLTACKDETSAQEATTFVLVHGAFADQYAWDYIKPLLEKEGDRVVTLDLPGHGDDRTPVDQITLTTYVAAVQKVIAAQPGKVVLVGHSMGGMVISQVAEAMPEKIDKLVYMCAYLPKNGEDLLTLGNTDTESQIGPNLKFAADFSTASLSNDDAVRVFAGDCTDDIKRLVAMRNKAEPLAPFQNKVTLTESRFGSVPKYYVKTLKDIGVGPRLQQRMLDGNGRVLQVYSIESGHTPYFAKPQELTQILRELSQKGR
jgi:pimeloyl-ACP methyl ester carboxylesterase